MQMNSIEIGKGRVFRKGVVACVMLWLFITFFLTHVSAQTVSQVTAEQQGQNVVVHYQLLTDTPCEVSLLVSLDRGKTWSEALAQCTGDVGKNIGTGAHSITWNVLAERTELWGEIGRAHV